MKKEKNLKITPYLYLVAEYSDLCSIFVLPICKDSLLKPFYDKQNGTGKNLCRSSELYRSA